ncbi:TetR/AcrR family transcriptional regulator [Nonomuraea sp. SYSU D8015]|uniref:TetR/AcrR family transcriptional regulator n=1 Tax=Nonomuraea sp. SYSU D8015 TaxID=2593644 RepID=UPI00166065E0|nr:TetR/AcrR family transcriptional regulator [Nonomuraea sp. SYSU D8015]
MARDQRRRDIAEALLTVAGERGLHAATMRAVAAQAGVSLHLVQHYFETKEQLMLYALRYLAERMAERLEKRFAGLDDDPRAVIEAVLQEALPTDAQSRVFHLVYTSYAVLAVTDPTLAAQPLLTAPNAMEDFIAAQLSRASPGLDARTEAVALLAMSAGLNAAVLAGQRTADDAMAVLRHQLDRLCPR